MKLESYRHFQEILVRVSYILVIPQRLPYSVDVQLSNEWRKSCKIIATCNLISNLLRVGKNIVAFWYNCRKTSNDCFALKVLTVGRLQNKNCIVSIITLAGQEKDNKIVYIAMKKWEKLQYSRIHKIWKRTRRILW